MLYFSSFPQTLYRFGDAENAAAAFQNISAYADVIDQFKNSEQSYLKYNILEGDRPDIVSAKLYGDMKYYWTFYLMNDNIRRQGWPLAYKDLVNHVKESYPHTTLVFRTDGSGTGHVGHTDPTQDLVKIFEIGSFIQGSISGASGTVIRKDLELGHVIISGSTGTWQVGETVYFNRITANPLSLFDPNPLVPYSDITIFEHAKLKSSSLEYLSAHHFEDANGKYIDINPNSETQSSFIVEKTHLDTLEAENSKLKSINILKPDVIRTVARNFIDIMSG